MVQMPQRARLDPVAIEGGHELLAVEAVERLIDLQRIHPVVVLGVGGTSATRSPRISAMRRLYSVVALLGRQIPRKVFELGRPSAAWRLVSR
jgi:hypothetical protein